MYFDVKGTLIWLQFHFKRYFSIECSSYKLFMFSHSQEQLSLAQERRKLQHLKIASTDLSLEEGREAIPVLQLSTKENTEPQDSVLGISTASLSSHKGTPYNAYTCTVVESVLLVSQSGHHVTVIKCSALLQYTCTCTIT